MAPSPVSDAEYAKHLDIDRREKDAFFKEHQHSPIPWVLRDKFTRLAYCPPSPK